MRQIVLGASGRVNLLAAGVAEMGNDVLAEEPSASRDDNSLISEVHTSFTKM